MSDKIVGYVYETMDYDQFKPLIGNRAVYESRVKKLTKSISENGVIYNPILVNETKEIIDGNGRFKVLSSMHEPIRYIICKGLSLKECIVFNTTSTKWTIMDYIDSYCDLGNSNYILLKKLITEHPKCSFENIMFAINGNVTVTHKPMEKGHISNGKLIIDSAMYLNASMMLNYADNFFEGFTCGGRFSYLSTVAMFVYSLPYIDNKKLLEKWNKYSNVQKLVPPIVDISQALIALQNIYNYKNKSEPVSFELEYDKYLRSRMAGYANRWSKFKEKN